MGNHIALCIEEMASNTVQHGFSKDAENHLSVRILHKPDAWVLRFRDDCRAFDPVSYVPRGEEDALGIRLVTAMADDIRYTYSLNLNNLTIKLTDQGS
jgi:two-component sensor histidine kinase